MQEMVTVYNHNPNLPMKITLWKVKGGVAYLDVTFGMDEPFAKTLPMECVSVYMRQSHFPEKEIQEVVNAMKG